MGPPEIKQDPAIAAQQQAQAQGAEADKISAIRDRLSGDTTDLLLRFGRRKALLGVTDLGGGLGNLASIVEHDISGASADNLFSGRGRLRL